MAELVYDALDLTMVNKRTPTKPTHIDALNHLKYNFQKIENGSGLQDESIATRHFTPEALALVQYGIKGAVANYSALPDADSVPENTVYITQADDGANESGLYQSNGVDTWTFLHRFYDNFLELLDTPGSYSGQAGLLLAVKITEDGVEFVSPPAGGVPVAPVFLGGNAYVQDNIVWRRASRAFTLAGIRLGAVTAPTGAALIGKVMYHATDPTSATTIFTTGPETEAPSIAAAGHTDDSGTPDVTSIAEGGWLGFGFSQIGSTIPGADITFDIIEG